MSLIVNQLDYGPLYNALGSLYKGRMAQAQQQENRANDIKAFTDILVEGVGALTGLMKETQVASAKNDVQAFDQEAQQKARDLILNNNYTIEDEATRMGGGPVGGVGATGEGQKTIKLPDDYEQWYKDAQENITKKYAGFPDVRSWAQDQLYQSYDAAKKTALNTFYAKTLDDRAKQETIQISNAQKDSIAHQDFRFTEAALQASGSLTPAEKETARMALQADYNYGVKSDQVQKAAESGGVDPALALIDGWSKGKQLSQEEEDKLRAQAITGANQASGLWQSRADTAFNAAIEKGGDPEDAVKQSLAPVPEAFKGNVEKVLRSDYQNHRAMVDDVADSEMLAYHDANPSNGAGLFRKLHDPKNDYARKMTTPTYTFWENMADRIMKPEKGDGTTLAAQHQLDDILRGRTWRQGDVVGGIWDTPEKKLAAIQELSHQEDPATGEYLVGTTTLNAYLEKAKNPVYYREDVNSAWNKITTFIEASAKKKGANPMADIQAAQAEFTRRLAGFVGASKEPTAVDVEDLVDSILQPHKSALLYTDQVDRLNARGEARALRAKASAPGGGFYLNQDEIVRLATRDRATFEQVYGVGTGTKPFLGTGADNRGIPVFLIKGMDAKNPDAAYWYQIATDAQGNEVLTGYDKTGHFIPVPVQTQQQLRQEVYRKDQATQDQLRAQVKQAAPTTPQQVKETAAALGVSAAEVAIHATEANPLDQGRFDQVYMSMQIRGILRRGSITAAEAEEIAKKTGATASQVLGVAAGRGLKMPE
jgi:hypothetical protein